MKNFYRVARRSFSSSQYHHGLEISKVPAFTLMAFSITVLEILRVSVYFYLTIKIAIRLPSYVAFNFLNFKKSKNNPDYMLCDEKTFAEMTKIIKI